MTADTLAASDSLASPDAPTSASPTRTAWGLVLLMAVVLLGGAVMRTVFGPLQEAARLDMHMSDMSMSLLQGFGAGLPIALFSIPLSWLVDHGNRMRLTTILLALCAVGTVWTSLAHGFYPLFAARMLASLGAACAISAVISLCADWCAPDRRGRALVILGLGVFIGAAAAFAVGGVMLQALSAHPLSFLPGMAAWRQTHLVIGVAGAALIIPLLFIREPKRREVEIRSNALGPIARALWAKRRFLAPLFIGQIGVTMADTAGAIWATPILIRDYHQQPAAFGPWVSGVLLLSGVIGSVLGGIGSDLGHKTGRRGGLLWAGVIATVIGVPAALFPIMPNLPSFAFLFFLLSLHGAITSVVSSAAVTVLIPNEERGACMAFFGVINAIVGLSIAPVIVTVTAKAMGGDQHLGVALAATGVVTGLVSVAGYVLAMKHAPLNATEAH